MTSSSSASHPSDRVQVGEVEMDVDEAVAFAQLLDRSSLGSPSTRRLGQDALIGLAERETREPVDSDGSTPASLGLIKVVGSRLERARDFEAAELWYRSSLVAQPDARTATQIAALLERKHDEESIRWYMSAAADGEIEAVNRLATLALKQAAAKLKLRGVKVNQAFRELRKSERGLRNRLRAQIELEAAELQRNSNIAEGRSDASIAHGVDMLLNFEQSCRTRMKAFLTEEQTLLEAKLTNRALDAPSTTPASRFLDELADALCAQVDQSKAAAVSLARPLARAAKDNLRMARKLERRRSLLQNFDELLRKSVASLLIDVTEQPRPKIEKCKADWDFRKGEIARLTLPPLRGEPREQLLAFERKHLAWLENYLKSYLDEDLLIWVGCENLAAGFSDEAAHCYSAAMQKRHAVAALTINDLCLSQPGGSGQLPVSVESVADRLVAEVTKQRVVAPLAVRSYSGGAPGEAPVEPTRSGAEAGDRTTRVSGPQGPTGPDIANEPDELIAAAMTGDRQAVERVLTIIRPLVARYCRARLGPSDRSFVSADDVAQEVCLAVLTALPGYRIHGKPFIAFVYGIAAHKVIDAHRASMRNRSVHGRSVPDKEAVDGPERETLKSELSQHLRQLLDELPDKQREILVLRVVVGLSAEETAEAVGSTPGAVRVAQHRALSRLRKSMPKGSDLTA